MVLYWGNPQYTVISAMEYAEENDLRRLWFACIERYEVVSGTYSLGAFSWLALLSYLDGSRSSPRHVQ